MTTEVARKRLTAPFHKKSSVTVRDVYATCLRTWEHGFPADRSTRRTWSTGSAKTTPSTVSGRARHLRGLPPNAQSIVFRAAPARCCTRGSSPGSLFRPGRQGQTGCCGLINSMSILSVAHLSYTSRSGHSKITIYICSPMILRDNPMAFYVVFTPNKKDEYRVYPVKGEGKPVFVGVLTVQQTSRGDPAAEGPRREREGGRVPAGAHLRRAPESRGLHLRGQDGRRRGGALDDLLEGVPARLRERVGICRFCLMEDRITFKRHRHGAVQGRAGLHGLREARAAQGGLLPGPDHRQGHGPAGGDAGEDEGPEPGAGAAQPVEPAAGADALSTSYRSPTRRSRRSRSKT